MTGALMMLAACGGGGGGEAPDEILAKKLDKPAKPDKPLKGEPPMIFGPEVRFDSSTNILYGTPGPDQLEGKQGTLELWGGPGDDEYTIFSYSGKIVERKGEGTDKVISAIDYTLPDNVENLSAHQLPETNHLTFRGNSLDNAIVGHHFTPTTIYGGDGDDRLELGSRGAGKVDGGDGNDTLILSYGLASGGAGADLFVAKAFGAHTSWNTPITITDFNGEEGDRIQITHIENQLTTQQLFEQNWMSFDPATGNLVYWQSQDTQNPRGVYRVIILQGVTEFKFDWLTVRTSLQP